MVSSLFRIVPGDMDMGGMGGMGGMDFSVCVLTCSVNCLLLASYLGLRKTPCFLLLVELWWNGRYGRYGRSRRARWYGRS